MQAGHESSDGDSRYIKPLQKIKTLHTNTSAVIFKMTPNVTT